MKIDFWMHSEMERLIFESKKRFKIAIGGRGSSKSLTLVLVQLYMP